MEVRVCTTKDELGRQAAAAGAAIIRRALAQQGVANVILATGASQFEMLSHLVQEPDINWARVICFHLDEYVGMPITHPASFRRYLKERFVEKLPTPPAAFHYIDAELEPQAECRRLGELIAKHPIDVAFIGIGENSHLAFNDPPADFATTEPYIVVELDHACRQQQFGEGWFPTFDAVPSRAISMSIQQILKSKSIVCSVPDERKANAVRGAVEGPISPECPASILQQHAQATIYLDPPAASLLKKK
jgi:glucosamine-6-phosphate deaminase